MNMKVANALRDEMGRIPGVKMYGPGDEGRRSSIVTFMPPPAAAVDASTIVKKLEQNSIVFAARDVGSPKKALRAAPHFFNSEEEAVTAASYVRALLK